LTTPEYQLDKQKKLFARVLDAKRSLKLLTFFILHSFLSY